MSGSLFNNSDDESISEIEYVPEILPARIANASRHNPPKPVMLNAVIADFREDRSVFLKLIRKKELILVNSQKTNNVIRLSEVTNPSIAPIKILRYV